VAGWNSFWMAETGSGTSKQVVGDGNRWWHVETGGGWLKWLVVGWNGWWHVKTAGGWSKLCWNQKVIRNRWGNAFKTKFIYCSNNMWTLWSRSADQLHENLLDLWFSFRTVKYTCLPHFNPPPPISTTHNLFQPPTTHFNHPQPVWTCHHQPSQPPTTHFNVPPPVSTVHHLFECATSNNSYGYNGTSSTGEENFGMVPPAAFPEGRNINSDNYHFKLHL